MSLMFKKHINTFSVVKMKTTPSKDPWAPRMVVEEVYGPLLHLQQQKRFDKPYKQQPLMILGANQYSTVSKSTKNIFYLYDRKHIPEKSPSVFY